MSENAALCLFVPGFWAGVWVADRVVAWRAGRPPGWQVRVRLPLALLALGCLLNWVTEPLGSWVVVSFHSFVMYIVFAGFVGRDVPGDHIEPRLVDQNYLDYADGVPALPSMPSPEGSSATVSSEPDPALAVAVLLSAAITFGAMIALDGTFSTQDWTPWLFLAYTSAFYAVTLSIVALVRRVPRRWSRRPRADSVPTRPATRN